MTSRRLTKLILLAFAVGLSPCSSIAADSISNVNITPAYFSIKTQKDSDLRAEVILQLPFPLLATKSKDTMLFGGILYLDAKTFLNINKNVASTLGLGKVYYLHSSSKHTIVPSVTIIRELSLEVKSGSSTGTQIEEREWLLPSLLYTYTLNNNTSLHFDADLYSYSDTTNYRSKLGVMHAFNNHFKVGVIYEEISWDMRQINSGYENFIRGSSSESSIKLIYSTQSKWNLSISLGYGNLENITDAVSIDQRAIDSDGAFIGIELSGAGLVW